MVVGYMLMGFIAGALAFYYCLSAGFSIWAALAADSLVGSISLVASAALLSFTVGPHEQVSCATTRAVSARKPRILVVDDDPVVLDLVSASLGYSGIADVTTVSSAQAALELLSTANVQFDCFLLDILMKEVDGIELCRHLRRDNRYVSTPILMLTRKSDQVHIDRAFAAGASDYILKPFDVTSFRRIVTEIAAPSHKENSTSLQADPQLNIERQKGEREFYSHYNFSDIPGFLEFNAIQNYLIQSNNVSAQAARVSSFRVRDAEEIFQSATTADFRVLMRRVAEGLSAATKRTEVFLAYAGAGVFLCATRNECKIRGVSLAKRANFLVHSVSEKWTSSVDVKIRIEFWPGHEMTAPLELSATEASISEALA